MISRHAYELGYKQPVKRLYAVGVKRLPSPSIDPTVFSRSQDNPDTDIFGANVYNRYLQTRALSKLKQVVTQTATASLTNNASPLQDVSAWNTSNAVEMLADDAEQYYSAENILSILVCTGVYNQEAYDESTSINHGHRDMIIDPELKKPKYTVEHVLDAVKLVFDLEQYH